MLSIQDPPFSFVTHHRLLFNPPCQTRHVDLFFLFFFSPLTVCPAGFCVIFSPWELNLGGGAVVSASITGLIAANHGRRPAAPRAIERLQTAGLSSKYTQWTGAVPPKGETGATSGQENAAKKKIYFSRKKVLFLNLSSELNCGVKKVLSALNLLPVLVLRSLSDGSQGWRTLDSVNLILIESAPSRKGFFLFFCDIRRKENGSFVSHQGRTKAPRTRLLE